MSPEFESGFLKTATFLSGLAGRIINRAGSSILAGTSKLKGKIPKMPKLPKGPTANPSAKGIGLVTPALIGVTALDAGSSAASAMGRPKNLSMRAPSFQSYAR